MCCPQPARNRKDSARRSWACKKPRKLSEHLVITSNGLWYSAGWWKIISTVVLIRGRRAEQHRQFYAVISCNFDTLNRKPQSHPSLCDFARTRCLLQSMQVYGYNFRDFFSAWLYLSGCLLLVFHHALWDPTWFGGPLTSKLAVGQNYTGVKKLSGAWKEWGSIPIRSIGWRPSHLSSVAACRLSWFLSVSICRYSPRLVTCKQGNSTLRRQLNKTRSRMKNRGSLSNHPDQMSEFVQVWVLSRSN